MMRDVKKRLLGWLLVLLSGAGNLTHAQAGRQDALLHVALQSVTRDNYPALYNYLQHAALQAPVLPYVYTKDGVSLFQSYDERITLPYYPSFFSDKKALQPIMEDIIVAAQNTANKQFEYTQTSAIPGESLTLSDLGLYTLLLIRLGFDRDHEDIKPTHALSVVSKELQAVVNLCCKYSKKFVKNSWHGSELARDTILEVRIAKLLKDDVALCEKAKSLVDLAGWNSFATYEKFLSQCASEGLQGEVFRTSDVKNPYRRIDVYSYLPGDEQMLAYAITTNIRNLWYATMNEALFYERTKKPVCDVATHVFLSVKNLTFHVPEWSLRLFKKAAYKKIKINDQQISFIDFWQELVARLKLEGKTKEDYFIASGGGSVLSFNRNLIEKQCSVLMQGDDTSVWNSILATLSSKRRMRLLKDLDCMVLDSTEAERLCGSVVKL